MEQKVSILVVDDEEIVRESLSSWLQEDGYEVVTAENGPRALERLPEKDWTLLLVDLKMPGMDGLQLMEEVHKTHPAMVILIMTAFATVDTAVNAMKEGAYDYLVKPFDPEDLSMSIRKIVEHKKLVQENQFLRKELKKQYRLHDMISKNDEMLGDLRDGADDLQEQLHGADPGRERDGEGAPRAGHPRGKRQEGRPLHLRLVRRPHRDAAGERAVRPREGGLHRGRSAEAGKAGAGAERDPFPRRDRGHQPQAAAGPPPGPRAEGVPPRRGKPGHRHRIADHRRHQPGPAEGDRGREVPGRPVLPAQRVSPSGSPRSGSGRRTSPCWWRASSTSSISRWASRSRG